MSGGVPSILNKYISRTIFEGILEYLHYTDKRISNIMMGYYAFANGTSMEP